MQAQLLAEGFLDTLGEERTLQPKETFTEIILLAAELVEEMQENLNRSRNNASGRLSESIEAGEPVMNGNTLNVDVFMNFYGKFQNKGVKGTLSGSSLAGYSFKTEMPSRKMVAAILEWIKRAKLSTRTVTKYKGYGGHEIKNKTISQYQSAFAVARSIKQHGIKPTGFLDRAAEKISGKVSDRLGKALVIDVIDSIKIP